MIKQYHYQQNEVKGNIKAEKMKRHAPMQIPLMAPFVQELVDNKSSAIADSTVTLEAATSLAFNFACMKNRGLSQT